MDVRTYLSNTSGRDGESDFLSFHTSVGNLSWFSTANFSYADLYVRLCESYGSKRPRLASEVELRVAAFCGPLPRRGEADASN